MDDDQKNAADFYANATPKQARKHALRRYAVSTQALDPCPFCGGAAEIERVGNRRMSTIYVCTMCGCRLETGEEWGHGRQWNTRYTPPTPLPGEPVATDTQKE